MNTEPVLAARISELKRPLLPARLFPLGAELNHPQPSGGAVRFRSVEVSTTWRGVPSKLDGFESTWHFSARRWIPVDLLAADQLQLNKVV